MADWLSSVKIGGTAYDIYAVSAQSAGCVPSTAIDGKIPESAISSIPETAITSIDPSAITAKIDTSSIPEIAWSAISGLTATSSESASTASIWTPQTTNQFVSAYVAGKISNVYKFKGTCSIDDLPPSTQITDAPENGDVWDLSVGGTINPSDATHSANVTKGDNVAWVTADGGYWDKLAESINIAGKLDTSAFTAWSANSNSDSTFLGSANSALTANVAVNVSGSASNVNGQDLINSALSGAAASAWIVDFETSGKPVWVNTSYLSGNGTTASPIGLNEPEHSIGASTDSNALVDAGGISSFVDSNYIAKTDITVDTSNHQLVINNQ